MPELSVVVPFYNEENNIVEVYKNLSGALSNARIDYELVMVNNGSSDMTAELLRKIVKKDRRVKAIEIKVNQGYGNGIIVGLSHAKGDVVGFIDGDNQITAGTVAAAYWKLKEEKLDFCQARRRSREDGMFRRIASKVYNLLVSLAFMQMVYDVNAKPKLINREVYNAIRPESKDWFIDTEIMVKAKKLGAKMGYVDADFTKRTEGKSNVRLFTVIEFINNVIRLRMELWNLKKR
jgi:glycosyltransferase involved in cell wall biosynthesis